MMKLQKIFDEHYATYIKDLTTISLDDENQQSLCQSDKKFFDYDSIVQHLASVQHEDSVCSPDIIHFHGEHIIFIEFKNGKIQNKDKKEIKLKGIEGGFIALYKIAYEADRKISFQEIVAIPKQYYLVYNHDKNQSRTKRIAEHLKQTTVRFGLAKYEGTFFSKVSTISSEVFMNQFLHKL